MTEPIESVVDTADKRHWDCAVYDSPPLEQTAPPYAVLERLPDITEPNAGLLRKYQAWRYAIYGVFPLANLIGASVGRREAREVSAALRPTPHADQYPHERRADRLCGARGELRTEPRSRVGTRERIRHQTGGEYPCLSLE